MFRKQGLQITFFFIKWNYCYCFLNMNFSLPPSVFFFFFFTASDSNGPSRVRLWYKFLWLCRSVWKGPSCWRGFFVRFFCSVVPFVNVTSKFSYESRFSEKLWKLQVYLGRMLLLRPNLAGTKEVDCVLLISAFFGITYFLGLRLTLEKQLQYTAETIKDALLKSLEKLQTSYIDLYQVHWFGNMKGKFSPVGYCQCNCLKMLNLL